MIFAEQPAWNGWTIEILGTDVSSKAIETARNGLYTQFEIERGISVRSTQFLRQDQRSLAGGRPDRAMTRFQQHNILDYPPSPGRFDLVLCRNVLLYFDPQTRSAAFDRLAGGTARGGWLMLGAGETVVGQTERFKPAEFGSSLYNPYELPARAPVVAARRLRI